MYIVVNKFNIERHCNTLRNKCLNFHIDWTIRKLAKLQGYVFIDTNAASLTEKLYCIESSQFALTHNIFSTRYCFLYQICHIRLKLIRNKT